jgi:hypothetical protein
MRTIDFTALEKRFQMAAGLATLTEVDEFFFKQAVNTRADLVWSRIKWPELQTLVEKTVAATTSPIAADKAVQIDNAVDIQDVFKVYNKNPLTDRSAILIDFQLINGYVVLPANSTQSSIFIMGNLVRPEYGKESGDEQNVPMFLMNYLVAGCLSDFLRGDGQTEKAMQEEQRAEEYLALEMDKAERIESQNKITFNTYPSYSFGVNILQTT